MGRTGRLLGRAVRTARQGCEHGEGTQGRTKILFVPPRTKVLFVPPRTKLNFVPPRSFPPPKRRRAATPCSASRCAGTRKFQSSRVPELQSPGLHGFRGDPGRGWAQTELASPRRLRVPHPRKQSSVASGRGHESQPPEVPHGRAGLTPRPDRAKTTAARIDPAGRERGAPVRRGRGVFHCSRSEARERSSRRGSAPEDVACHPEHGGDGARLLGGERVQESQGCRVARLKS